MVIKLYKAFIVYASPLFMAELSKGAYMQN